MHVAPPSLNSQSENIGMHCSLYYERPLKTIKLDVKASKCVLSTKMIERAENGGEGMYIVARHVMSGVLKYITEAIISRKFNGTTGATGVYC
jgi:hypothetical protein